GPIGVSLYGRDAADAQVLSKSGRFLFYRDSGPALSLSRLQHVEHEAYMTLLAERSGVATARVLVAGIGGPRRDAALVVRPPQGVRLAEFEPAPVTEEATATDGAAATNGSVAQAVVTTDGAVAEAVATEAVVTERAGTDEPIVTDRPTLTDGGLDSILAAVL